MNVTDEIKNRLDLVDIVSETVQLRKSGRSYSGFCPFHQNTRTPAFVVFPDTQTWRCFGACAEGGDLFSYVMKRQGWDFKETLEHLAQRAGVQLEELTPAAQQQKAEKERLADLLNLAADYFHHLLLYAPDAEGTRRYVARRALEEQTIATFKLGFALNSWDACRSHFNGQGYSDDDLVAAGLLSENPERNTRYDRFRHRLMIPIRDVTGRVVGFGARTLEKDGVPKYLNSPQTDLFDKSHLLYGLDMAKRHIREARQAIIVEGYMDVMQGWQVGFRNLVAQMGTALTETQLRLLKRYTKRFVIALDADAAGVQATMRGLQVARSALDREVDVRFDAPHLVRHEGRLQADIRIVTLPAGKDPDQIIRTEPTLWPKLIESAKPVVAYVIETTTRDLNLNDAKAKAEVVAQVMPLIQDVADAVERDHYRQQLARTLRVDERTLQQVALAPRPGRQQAAPVKVPGRAKKTNGIPRTTAPLTGGKIALPLREEEYLRHCLLQPHLIDQVNARLEANQQPGVNETDFSNATDRTIFQQWQRWLHKGAVASIEELCDSLDETLQQRVQSLTANDTLPDVSQERLSDSLALSILDLRLERIRRQLNDVQQLFYEAQTQGNISALNLYRQQLQRLPVTVQQIHKARFAMSAVSRRHNEEANR